MNIATLPPEIISRTKANDVFIAIIFIAPKSAQWKTVSFLLGSADDLVTKDDMVCAFFRKEYASVATAFQILEIAFKWKSCYAFMKGVPLLSYKDLTWVQCFMASFRVESLKAHCLTATYVDFKDPADSRRLKTHVAVLPCKKLAFGAGYNHWLPINYEKQLQAHAVKKGVDLCPNYGIFKIPSPQPIS